MTTVEGVGMLCVGAVVLLSLACVIHLWRRKDGSRWRKTLWAVLLWIPLFGPFFYVAMYRIPPRKPDSEIPETGYQY